MRLQNSRHVRHTLAKFWLLGYRALQKTRRLASPTDVFRILLFHGIPMEQRQVFRSLIESLSARRAIISPDEAARILNGSQSRRSAGQVQFLITFDDGFSSNALVAREILDKLDIKAVFFVCPGIIDASLEQRRALTLRYQTDVQLPHWVTDADLSIMSWHDVEGLVRSGHTVGSHTLHHIRLSQLSYADKRKEIIDSGNLLEQHIGVAVKWFAPPFGNLSSVDVDSYHLITQRYEFSCTGLRGSNSKLTHPLGLLREQLDLTAPHDYRMLVIEGGLDFYYHRHVQKLRSWLEQIDQTGRESNQSVDWPDDSKTCGH